MAGSVGTPRRQTSWTVLPGGQGDTSSTAKGRGRPRRGGGAGGRGKGGSRTDEEDASRGPGRWRAGRPSGDREKTARMGRLWKIRMDRRTHPFPFDPRCSGSNPSRDSRSEREPSEGTTQGTNVRILSQPKHKPGWWERLHPEPWNTTQKRVRRVRRMGGDPPRNNEEENITCNRAIKRGEKGIPSDGWHLQEQNSTDLLRPSGNQTQLPRYVEYPNGEYVSGT